MSNFVNSGLRNVGAFLLTESNRSADSGVQIHKSIKSSAANTMHRIGTYEAVVFGCIWAEIHTDIKCGMRPSGLGQVFDCSTYSGVTFNQQYITWSQRGLQMQGVGWWRCTIDFELFAEINSQGFTDCTCDFFHTACPLIFSVLSINQSKSIQD
jgi:hypothetical protein